MKPLAEDMIFTTLSAAREEMLGNVLQPNQARREGRK